MGRLCHGAVLGRWHLTPGTPTDEARTMNSMALKTCRGLVHGFVSYIAQERLKLVNPVALDDTLLTSPLTLLTALRDEPTLHNGAVNSFDVWHHALEWTEKVHFAPLGFHLAKAVMDGTLVSCSFCLYH